MIVVSSREFRDNQKRYFELAKEQRVIIKRNKEFIELVPRGTSIPENPSPSNDTWFDNPKNLAALHLAIKQSKEGNVTRFSSLEEIDKLLDI